MGNATVFTFIITFTVEFITGTLLNGFILGVNCVDLVKRRKISTMDQIITALAISRVVLCLVVLSALLSLAYSEKVTIELVKIIIISWVVTNHFNLWLSTKLSMFYFFKIVNFSNSIFLYLKWRVTKVISVTLILSLVLLFSHVAVINIRIDAWIDASRRNLSFHSSSRNSAQFVINLLLTNTLFSFMPFTVSLTAFLLLSLSLWKHHRQMQTHSRSSRDARAAAHVKALQTGIGFLLLYTTFLLCLFINMWSIDFLGKYVTAFLSIVTGTAFFSLHSCVLILGNSKLKRASFSVLWWLRCRSKGAGFSGP
uniref:Taste receptor type 2 n=1 Tax=Nannospalax galili TaxID=1026970 RepID=A0A0N9NZ27_NANGA|nr:taste receptor type 2 member 1 [Nannospalax galili]